MYRRIKRNIHSWRAKREYHTHHTQDPDLEPDEPSFYRWVEWRKRVCGQGINISVYVCEEKKEDKNVLVGCRTSVGGCGSGREE